jgi:hypothetical protein
MTSGTEWQDPFLVKPDQPVRNGRPIAAPPPMGPRFDGPPASGYSAPPTRAVDPSIYALNAPTGYSPAIFSRTWKVTFKRWGRGWLAFLALGVLAASVLAPLYPSHASRYSDDSMGYYFGVFTGLAVAYLVFVGWWLDHVLASSGWVMSLVVQAIIAGFFGVSIGLDPEGNGDLPIDFPLVYLGLVGVGAIALGQWLGRKVKGSFRPSEGAGYPPSPM